MTNPSRSREGDVSSTALASGKHGHSRKRHTERPCPCPPAAPTNVVITFTNNGTRVHPDFSAKVKWDATTTDECGRTIPGGRVQIDHYQGQMLPCRANGNAIETEDGHPRVRRFHVPSVRGIKVIDATIVSGTIAEFTTRKNHNLVADEKIHVQDIKPPAYSGVWIVLSAGLTATKFRADIGASPGNLEDEGNVEGEPDPTYNWIREKVPHPKRWWWKARIRAWDTKGCASDWSDFSSVVSPTTNAAPPQPNVVRIFNQAVNRIAIDWNDPIDYIAIDGTATGSSGTNTLVGTDTKFLADLAEPAGVGKPGIWIKVGADLRRVTAISSDTALTVNTNWSTTHTDATVKVEDRDPDVHYYQVQLDTATDFDDPYLFDRKQHRSFFAVKIPDADQSNTFYGRVRSVDHEGKASKWIPATTAGNSSPSATPSGVTVGSGGGAGITPDAPTGVALTFDTTERHHHQKWRCKVEWDEVTTPGGVTIDHYVINFAKSDDNATWETSYRRVVVEAKDDDADTIAWHIFHTIRKWRYYRARVRAVSDDGKKGAYSSWTSGESPAADAPPTPVNVTIHEKSTNRIAVTWEAPDNTDDATLITDRIAYFQVKLMRDTTAAP